MPVADSQGLTASFAGVSLGPVWSFDDEHSAGAPYEFTPAAATVVGTGLNSRVVRQLNWATVENGTLSFRVWGSPIFVASDMGTRGTLAFSVGGVSVSRTAAITKSQRAGERGGLVQTAYSFTFTGED
jgi:hypothetical protein